MDLATKSAIRTMEKGKKTTIDLRQRIGITTCKYGDQRGINKKATKESQQKRIKKVRIRINTKLGMRKIVIINKLIITK